MTVDGGGAVESAEGKRVSGVVGGRGEEGRRRRAVVVVLWFLPAI